MSEMFALGAEGDEDEQLLTGLLSQVSAMVSGEPLAPEQMIPDFTSPQPAPDEEAEAEEMDELGFVQPGFPEGGGPQGTIQPAPPGSIPPLLGNVNPGQDGVPQGLQPNAARGAAAAKRLLGFDGTIGGVGQRDNRSDHPHGNAIDLMTHDDVAFGWTAAQFYVGNRAELGVTYVIFDGMIASPRGDWQWRPYRHPAGRTDDTALHKDHVHVSFAAGSSASTGTPGRDAEVAVAAVEASLPAKMQGWMPAIASAAATAGIDPALLAALVQHESGGDPDATSHAGAQGLTQLMPGTARGLGVDPHDPFDNLAGGARYLREQLDRFGSVELALAAYNAGPGRVQQAGNAVPNIAETRNYVAKVMATYESLRSAKPQPQPQPRPTQPSPSAPTDRQLGVEPQAPRPSPATTKPTAARPATRAAPPTDRQLGATPTPRRRTPGTGGGVVRR